ncbi:MAG: 16S rRNA (cytidine(1402)-2'-O)-methyltransferase [Paracoccaceae bacterium]
MISKEVKKLDAGLYFVATPIGSARDITLRALDVLYFADLLIAEDTRSLKKLMNIHQIPIRGRKVISYNDHNGERKRPLILEEIKKGKAVSYCSEAGSPLIADPGFQLGREAIKAGYKVLSVPGACALIAALTVAGLPTNQFFYAGFLPTTKNIRIKFLENLKEIPATIVFYESPKRLNKSLSDMLEVMGPDRSLVIARELTKKFEEIIRTSLAEVQQELGNRVIKGEIVILLGKKNKSSLNTADIKELLLLEFEKYSLKESVANISLTTGINRSKVYKAALELIKKAELP